MPATYKLLSMNKVAVEAAALVFQETFAAPPWVETWSLEAARKRLIDIYHTPGFLGVMALDIDTNKPVGFGLGSLEYWIDDRHFQIKEFCVHPTRQRQGIAKALIASLHKKAVKQNVKQIYLLTARNTPAHKMYQAVGFKENKSMLILSTHMPA